MYSKTHPAQPIGGWHDLQRPESSPVTAAEKSAAQRLVRFAVSRGGSADLYARVVDSAQRAVIGEALKLCRANQSAAANLLGISRNSLRAKMAKFGMAGW